MSGADAVRAASERFYDALNSMVNGDPAPMSEIWWHSEDVTTMHPVGGRETGWDEVQASWQQIAEISSGGSVELRDRAVHVTGDVARELGREDVTVTLAGERVDSEIRVTNVYRRRGGEWKMVHHHTDTDPDMKEVVAEA